MLAEKQIQERIDYLLADERLSYAAATTFENAPLALIQLSMEVEIHTLQKVLGQPLTNFAKLRKRKTGCRHKSGFVHSDKKGVEFECKECGLPEEDCKK